MGSANLQAEHLIALCHELKGLSGSGVPLPDGLRYVAHELPRSLRPVADHLATRLAAGEDLQNILANEELQLPPIFQAMVTAGVKSGQLPTAFEAVSRAARRIAELRQTIVISLAYPLLLMVLVAFCAVLVLPKLSDMYLVTAESQNVDSDSWFLTLASWSAMLRHGLWFAPLIAVTAAGIWVLRSRRAFMIQPQHASKWFGWLPWIGPLLQKYQTSHLCQLLAMLIARQIPLDESLLLASNAVGNLRWQHDCQSAAQRINQGQPAFDANNVSSLPPFLTWLLSNPTKTDEMVSMLDEYAVQQQQLAEDQAYWLRTFLPIYLTILLGGIAVAIYAFIVLAPWYGMLEGIGTENIFPKS
ncbi:MAG: type II secretion system F family protein [Planctomycetales bacterium]|nr:type II secretion system F family protein [Planctomycetales bacterium]